LGVSIVPERPGIWPLAAVRAAAYEADVSDRPGLSPGFVLPWLPTKATEPALAARGQAPRLRVIARDGNRVRLYSRPGNDLTCRFPLIVEALARLRPRSILIDGEAVV
jgi:hypothetical protein